MRNKGSITIFSILALLLISAALFSLLEATRYQEIYRFAQLQTQMALESAFSNYQEDLWQQYRLLGMKSGDTESILMQVADARSKDDGVNLLRFEVENKSLSKTLLTDAEGAVFIESVSSYMKENILYETAKEIYQQYEEIKKLLEYSKLDTGKIDEAIGELEKIEQGQTRATAQRSSMQGILEIAREWKNGLVLGAFVEEAGELSSNIVNLEHDLFHRKLQRGNLTHKYENSWLDKVLLQQYLLTYLSNYETQKEGRALSYEAEFLIGKSSSDKENLMAVVAKIMVIREAANFAYLLSDSQKVQQAHSLAATIAATASNPALLEVLNIAILTTWALGESVLDVRALLAGKTLPLLKSQDQWTLELDNVSLIKEKFILAKESNTGLDYMDYLGILLLFEEEQQLAMRAMNVQELTIRNISGETDFKMDTLSVRAEAEMDYNYKMIFPFLAVLDIEENGKIKIHTKREYGYY